MTTPSKVRLAIIGAGGISGAHAEGILQHPDKVECVALCDVSAENLENRSKQLGGAPAKFNDWNEMYRVAGGWIDEIVAAAVLSELGLDENGNAVSPDPQPERSSDGALDEDAGLG